MKISYKDGSPADILAAIEENLGGRKLGKMLSCELRGNDLSVTIKKMGTSKLKFTNRSSKGGVDWELTEEKIAMAHRAFKGEMLAKLNKIIAQTGGTMNS